jgi:hypothetical protein
VSEARLFVGLDVGYGDGSADDDLRPLLLFVRPAASWCAQGHGLLTDLERSPRASHPRRMLSVLVGVEGLEPPSSAL